MAPTCSLVLTAVLYLFLRPLMPSHIAIHAGPDGVGYGSPLAKIAVGIISLGYGALGLALSTIVSTVGADPAAVSGDSVGLGRLGFLVLFTAAALHLRRYVATGKDGNTQWSTWRIGPRQNSSRRCPSLNNVNV